MLTEGVDKERAVRFYKWSLADAEREVRQRYPLLRSIQNVDVVNYLRTIEGMKTEEQLRLARAFVNRSHSAARCLLGESSSLGETLGTEEQILIDDHLFDTRLKRSAIAQEFYEKSLKGKPYNRGRFTKLMVKQLEPILGLPLRKEDESWIFVTEIPGWFVGTRVKIVRQTNFLRYWQNVMARPDEFPGSLESPSQNGTNILVWLGLGKTEISVLCEQDEEPVSEALANVCRHYLSGITDVLSDLPAEVMKEDEWGRVHWWQRLHVTQSKI